jgi:hypothetical protein
VLQQVAAAAPPSSLSSAVSPSMGVLAGLRTIRNEAGFAGTFIDIF